MRTYANVFFELRGLLKFDTVMQLIDDCDINDSVDNLTKITIKQDLERNFVDVIDCIVNSGESIHTWQQSRTNEVSHWEMLIKEADGMQKNRLNLFVVLNRMLPSFNSQTNDLK